MENCVEKYKLWDTAEIFNCPPDHIYAFFVLNRPIECEQAFVRSIWEKGIKTTELNTSYFKAKSDVLETSYKDVLRKFRRSSLNLN